MKKLLLLASTISIGFSQVKIVSSTTDLGDIAKSIGGDRVKVTTIARGNQDPHYVEVLPSYMMKVKRADIYLMVGMELDIWAQQIIDGSRNRKITIVDCSEKINPLEVPPSNVDASQGDVHRFGNPHYWLDPLNGILIAETIRNALVSKDPKGRDTYERNMESFRKKIESSLKNWQIEFQTLDEKRLLFYHNSWPYFSNRFGLKTVGFLEPKPGIMPSPAQLERVIEIVKTDEIFVLASESYFSTQAPDFITQKTGLPSIKLAQSVGALPGVESYLDIFDYNLKALMGALEASRD